MPLSKINLYNCKYCNRNYKLKPNYDKHYLLCDTLNKTRISKPIICKNIKENNADYVPSLRDMFTIILELTAKNSQLEQRVEELSKWAESKKKKLNVIDWLNEKYTKNIKYTEWLGGINITRNHLEAVFKTDMVTGCYEILQNLLTLDNTNINGTDDETMPIKAFTQKDNILFIYNDENKWEILSQPMFANLMNTLSKNILTEFLKWQTENKSKMRQDEFSYTYARNVQKIMGGNLTQEQIHMRVKKELYNYLKMNLRNVVEYEFSF